MVIYQFGSFTSHNAMRISFYHMLETNKKNIRRQRQQANMTNNDPCFAMRNAENCPRANLCRLCVHFINGFTKAHVCFVEHICGKALSYHILYVGSGSLCVFVIFLTAFCLLTDAHLQRPHTASQSQRKVLL